MSWGNIVMNESRSQRRPFQRVEEAVVVSERRAGRPRRVTSASFMRISAVTLALVAVAPVANGATITWNTTTGLWSDGANWLGGNAPANDTTTDTAFFSQSNSDQNVQFNADRSITGITIANTSSTSFVSDSATARLLTLGTSGLTVNAGAGVVTLGTSTAPVNLAVTTGSVTNNSSTLLTIGGNISRAASDGTARTLTFAGSGNTTVSGSIFNGGAASNLAVTKSGAGTLSLAGGLGFSGGLTVSAGTLSISGNASGTSVGLLNVGASISASPVVSIASATLAFGTGGGSALGNTAGQRGVMTIGQSAVVQNTTTFNDTFNVGFSGAGVVNQAGGSATFRGGGFFLARSNNSYGAYLLSGGTVAGTERAFSIGNSGPALFRQTGGTGTSAVTVRIGNTSLGVGVADFSGGTFTTGSTAGFMWAGNNDSGATATGVAIVTVRDSAYVQVTGTGFLLTNSSGSATGIVNLLGGTLEVNRIGKLASANAKATLNADGGTLKVFTTNGGTNFLQGLDNAFVYSGGFKVDTNGQSVTIAQPLTAPAGYGVLASGSTITVASGGSGYIAPPVVRFSVPAGGGVAATGLAAVDANGTVTGITITSPGSGYSQNESVTVTYNSGTNVSGAAVTVAPSFTVNASTLNASGGLRKLSSGTLTLAGANTYTGQTRVSAGVLALGVDGSFANSNEIKVGDAGSSGAVLDLTAKASGFSFGSGQTVSGIGTIRMASGQTLTLNGTLAPGNSPGTLTVEGGDLLLGGSSITQYEINGTDNTVGGGINDLTRVAGSLTLGGTLNVLATPSFDVFGSRTYRVFDYATGSSGSLAGSMSIGSTPDANYLYSLNTATPGQVNLFVQRKAEQAAALAYSQPTSGTVNAFTNTNVSFSGTLANLSLAGGAGLTVSLGGTGGQLSVGSLAASSGSSVDAGSSATVTGQIATGSSLGTHTWSVVNTDSGAIGSQTSTANGVVNVFAHGTPTLSGTSINFGYVLVGTSTSRSLDLSNGAFGSPPVPNTAGITWTSGTLPGGFTGGGANSTGVIASGGGASYSFTLATGSAGASTGSQTFSFADDSSILGSGALGTQSVSLTGTVLYPATASFASGMTTTSLLLNIGEFNQNTGDHTKGFSIFNLLTDPSYTADLTLESITELGTPSNSLSMNLTSGSFGNLLAGGTSNWLASLSSLTTGSFANSYQLNFVSSKNGKSLGGSQSMTLTVTGVIIVPEPGALALAGIGVVAVAWAARRRK